MKQESERIPLIIQEDSPCAVCAKPVPFGSRECPFCGAKFQVRKRGKPLHPALEMTLFLIAIPILFLIAFLCLVWLHTADNMMLSLAILGVVGIVGFGMLAPNRK